MSQPQPPWNPEDQQGQQPYPGEQYGPFGAQPPQDPRQPPPGWYADPGGSRALRWWDGTAWTPHTQPQPDLQPPTGPQPGTVLPTAGPAPQPGRRRSQARGNSHWVRNIFAGLGALVVAGVIISNLSSGSSSSSSTPAAVPDSAPSAAATAACTTDACIASDAQQSLPGTVAKDDSVMTKATCKPSTVKRNAGGTYTVTCTVTYSDGMVARGDANLIPAQNEITFEPTDIINYGSGG